METSKIKQILDKHLIGDRTLADSSGLTIGTIRNLKNRTHKSTLNTKRKFLDALNEELIKIGVEPVTKDIYSSDK